METTTILYIILSLIIGGSITFVLKKNKRISELTSENASLLSKLSESENKVKKISQDSEKTIDDVKERYKTLLNETQEQCKKLDKQLKNALEGIVDESIKEQLAEVEQLKKKIIDLEEEIEEKEDDVSTLKKKIRNYCCPVKVLHGKKIRLKPSCRIPASFVTLLVAKKTVVT